MIIHFAMEIVCAWCKCHLGWTEGEGVTHGICKSCAKAQDAEIEALRK